MKKFQFIAFLLFSIGSFGQSSIKKNLESINSMEEAEQFVQSHPKLQPTIKIHNSQIDTSSIDQKLYQLKTGEILSIGNCTYKIISDTLEYAFKASYIFLDGSILSKDAIDSLRKVILQQYVAGTTFEQLADKFTNGWQ